MADDVFDCWEEIGEEDIDFKLQKLNISKDVEEKMTSRACSSNSGVDQFLPAATTNSIKILKRPTNSNTTEQTVLQRNSSSNATNKNYDMNNFVDSEPFFPKNNHITSNECVGSARFPQITFEDQTRTQYVRPVKILKRPKENESSEGGGKLSPVKNSLNNGKSRNERKSYEEREANYAKARLRILGSAVPTYESTTEEAESKPANPGPSRLNGDVNKGEVDVPILRLPQGPDGSRGFTVKSIAAAMNPGKSIHLCNNFRFKFNSRDRNSEDVTKVTPVTIRCLLQVSSGTIVAVRRENSVRF